MLFGLINLSAQEKSKETIPTLFEFEEPIDNSTTSARLIGAKMMNRINNSINLEIRNLSFINPSNLLKSKSTNNDKAGFFNIKLPSNNKKSSFENILAIPKQIEAQENGDFLYVAELVSGKNLKGGLIITHKDDQNFGSLIFEDRSFIIEADETYGEFLIELDSKIINNEMSCGVDLLKSENNIISTNKSINNNQANSSSSTNRNVRILIAYTDAALLVSNPFQLGSTLIAQTNASLRNSQISAGQLNFELAAYTKIDLDETTNPISTLNAFRTDNQINTIRQELFADLVVVFTDGNYVTQNGTVLGIAALYDYPNPQTGFIALVEADAGGLTFAHEVGHLMGCRHDTDDDIIPSLSPTAKGHSWYIRNCFFCQKLYRKSVVASGLTTGIRQMYFSNPAVKSESSARDNTGTSTRNNYLQLLTAAPIVAAYDPFVPLSVSIDGPDIVESGDTYTLTANVNNCNSSINYQWSISYDGFNYTNTGTNSSITTTASALFGSEVYYRSIVTCGGQSRTAFSSVFIIGGSGGPFLPNSINTDDLQFSILDTIEPNAISFYPNSARDEIFISTNFTQQSRVIVKVYSVLNLGTERVIFDGTSVLGSAQHRLDISDLDQGLYEMKIFDEGTEIFSKKLLISR
jgi:hypothetical protein